MRIGIIMHPYGEKNPGGLPRIIFGWAKALLSTDHANDYLIFFKEEPKALPALPGDNWTPHVLGSGRFWLNRLKWFPEADVYLFNTPVLPFLWKPRRAVIIAQDYPYKYLKARNLSEYLSRSFISFYHGYSLRRADHIVAISESTKRDTMRFFNIPERKITVVYQGFTDVCALPETGVSLPEKFFFFAGTIKERKNVLSIVKAFTILRSRVPGCVHKLVIAGKAEGSYYEEICVYIKEHGMTNEIIFLGHLNENQLSYAYKRAEALVFPSLIEGAGLPVLEAMACGIPVITSNSFGPSELGGNGAAVLIDPRSPEDIASAMERIILDPSFRQERVRRGLEQSKRFSWNTTVRDMLSVLTRTAAL